MLLGSMRVRDGICTCAVALRFLIKAPGNQADTYGSLRMLVYVEVKTSDAGQNERRQGCDSVSVHHQRAFYLDRQAFPKQRPCLCCTAETIMTKRWIIPPDLGAKIRSIRPLHPFLSRWMHTARLLRMSAAASGRQPGYARRDVRRSALGEHTCTASCSARLRRTCSPQGIANY